MWTAKTFDTHLTQIASQHPNRDSVLTGYLNLDPEGRDFFERRVSQLRTTIPASGRSAWTEAVSSARKLLKITPDHYPAIAFFVRGGRRMFLFQAPLALPVINRVSQSSLPALYPLCEMRDNLDSFSLIHVQPDATYLSHFEMGAIYSQLAFRAPLGSTSWRDQIDSAQDLLLGPPGGSTSSPWILAGTPELLADSRKWISHAVDLLPVDSAADPHITRRIALDHFLLDEEVESRNLAHELISSREQGEPVQCGPLPVLSALATRPVHKLVLHARTPKDMALNWLRKQDFPFSFHDQAAWFACRKGTHVEVVNQSEELLAAGGSACL